MTPQEKAKQLFGKYAMYLRANLRYDEEADEDAKHCAIMAVDEILEDQVIEDGMFVQYPNYWIQVKRELEKL